jgi:hypothetical protein
MDNKIFMKSVMMTEEKPPPEDGGGFTAAEKIHRNVRGTKSNYDV